MPGPVCRVYLAGDPDSFPGRCNIFYFIGYYGDRYVLLTPVLLSLVRTLFILHKRDRKPKRKELFAIGNCFLHFWTSYHFLNFYPNAL